MSQDHLKLKYLFDLIKPGVVMVQDGPAFEKALKALDLDGVTVVHVVRPCDGIKSIAFLKLDIEGSELKALRGATRLLNERAISKILVETSLEAHLRPNAEAIDMLLRSAGYRSHRVKRDGTLVPIDVLDQRELREDILWTLA